MSRSFRLRQPGGLQREPDTFTAAYLALGQHPLFAPLLSRAIVIRDHTTQCMGEQWCLVSADGRIDVNPTREAEEDVWRYALAACLLHLGLGHFQRREDQAAWDAACEHVVGQFLHEMHVGTPPQPPPPTAPGTEEELYQRFKGGAIRPEGVMRPIPDTLAPWHVTAWPGRFARGLAEAASHSVAVAGGQPQWASRSAPPPSRARRALSWFVVSFPLLSALASTFSLVEDPHQCERRGIRIAAVDVGTRQIFVNPWAGLSERECVFVVGHELLHAGLRHASRRGGRNPLLWNVACDAVINQWLVEMGMGWHPPHGGVHIPDVAGKSAEQVYDWLLKQPEACVRLVTLAGKDCLDILDSTGCHAHDGAHARCLTAGLAHHQAAMDTGTIPLGLVEEICGTFEAPIPWDVELARWFDTHVAGPPRRPSYARLSRRQSSTPDIPRPGRLADQAGHTFGVVLDTSGSMDRPQLARSLGAIVGYAVAHDVGQVRLVFCDTQPYDAGWVAPETLLQPFPVQGRGGTILQPAVDYLEAARDFPEDGPLLIITDGFCDAVRSDRPHAVLVLTSVPHTCGPTGQVFRLES